MNSADTADQMMKMTLEGIEVAAEIGLKAGGQAAKSLAVTLYAIITDNKKIRGKTNLDNLLKSGKELKVFAIHHKDLEKFCIEAKHYGVLYSVLMEKDKTNFSGVVLLPLDIFERYTGNSVYDKLIDDNLDYLITSIKPHGLWEAPFDWSNEIAEGATAGIKWIGVISCINFYNLKKFGRIEDTK